MDYDVPFVHGDVVICGCEVKCFVEKVLADGWIEFLDVEANKTTLITTITLRAKLNPYLERGMITTFFVCGTEPKTK